jgi:uncharacterized radical SAM protein YgiQ
MASLVREARSFTGHCRFKGIISNVGGPTANMYAMTCDRIQTKGACSRKSCLFPRPCRSLKKNHGPQIRLLRALGKIPGIRKVFVGSGLRHDLVVADTENGENYLEEIIRHHASGQLKIAPEHVTDEVLSLMGKPGREELSRFLKIFERAREKSQEKIYLTYYLMAAHPGCILAHMEELREYALKNLKILPEQVQIFTPSPSTFATLMYWTEKDPFTGKGINVEKTVAGKQKQKDVMKKNMKLTPRRQGRR